MPLLLADFIYSRDCKLNLRKNADTTTMNDSAALDIQLHQRYVVEKAAAR